MRESPATVVADLLVRLGGVVRAAEPHAGPAAVTNEGVTLVDLTGAELAAADAVVVLADHDSFDYTLIERHARYVFDTRNRCHGPSVEAL